MTREIGWLVPDDMPDGCPKHGIDIGVLVQADVVRQHVVGVAAYSIVGLLREQG